MMKPIAVVKYGGNAMKNLELRRAIAKEIAALRQFRSVVVVHGGGPVIERDLSRLGIESHFLRGLRITTPEALEVIEKAITALSKELAQDITNAIGLTGRDMNLLQAEIFEPEFGQVGRVHTVNTNLIKTLLAQNITPVIGCIALNHQGQALNINADWAAGAVAGQLSSEIIFLTDVPGVMQDPKDPSSLCPILLENQAVSWINQGIISGGMIPKVEAALNALSMGAPKATIASGMKAGVLELALQGAAGTTFSPNQT
jgi:acetylglutamate kinase